MNKLYGPRALFNPSDPPLDPLMVMVLCNETKLVAWTEKSPPCEPGLDTNGPTKEPEAQDRPKGPKVFQRIFFFPKTSSLLRKHCTRPTQETFWNGQGPRISKNGHWQLSPALRQNS
jgi:hypothetical protein